MHGVYVEAMVISESSQVTTIIKKFSPSWKDFKNYLKHKKNEMGVEDLVIRPGIEENNKLSGRRKAPP